ERAPRDAVAGYALAVDAGGELVLVAEDPRELGADGRLSGEPGRAVVQGRGGVAEELAVELVAVDVVDPRVDLRAGACCVDLVGDVKPVVIGRQLAARSQAEDHPGAAPTRRGLRPLL